MSNAKSGTLLPYVFYFLMGYGVIFAFLFFLNTIGLRNFAFIETCFIGASFSSYLFFRKYQRAMWFAEQSKVTWVSILILVLLIMGVFFSLVPQSKIPEEYRVHIGSFLALAVIIFGLGLLSTIIFTLSFFKMSAKIIQQNAVNPSKIIQVFLTVSLTFFIADIIVNFLFNLLRH